MGGKAAMLLVLGFSLIFLVFGNNFNSLTTRAVVNQSDYYNETMAHNLAVTGANLAANAVFMDKNWDDGYEDLAYQGGIINVYVTNPTAGTGSKVKVCHKPGTSAQHTISVASSAVSAHLAHGDYLGDCSGGGTSSNIQVVIYSEGIFPDPDNCPPDITPDTFSVYVELQPSNFAKYGNFYDAMNSAIPATGDTFDGPFHVNNTMRTWGSPVFLGKVTSKGGLVMYNTKNPEFHGGYQSGVDRPRPWDTTNYRSVAFSGGAVFRDTTGSGKRVDVEMEFKSNGKVKYRYRIFDGSATWTPYKTKNLSDVTSNGLIYIEKGNVYIKGTLKGKATVVVTKHGVSNCGNIYQVDDLKYKTDPRDNPNSTDMLGLVAEQDIRLVYNDDTKHDDIITMASMYAKNGTVGPDDALIHNDGYLAEWKILGGIIAKDVRVTAHYNYSGPYEGYKFVHDYDERFLTRVPPYFPHAKDYEVVSWFE